MTVQELVAFYETKKGLYTEMLRSTRRRIDAISTYRLAAAIIFLATLYFAFGQHSLFYFLPPLIIIFVLLVRRHAALFHRKAHLEILTSIQSRELKGLSGDHSDNSGGFEFVNVHHPYTHDLDIFGEGSLFQSLNRSGTSTGRKILAAQLSARQPSPEETRLRQKAVAELSGKPEFCQEIQALSMQIDEQPGDQAELERWLAEPARLYGTTSYKLILVAFPILTLGLIIAAWFVDGLTAFAVLAAGMQWAFLGFHLKRVNAFHQYISRKKNALAKYANILMYIRKEQLTSSLLQTLGRRAQRADEKVRQLASLVGAFDARLNSMTNLVMNSLFLYDLQCVYQLERWKAENAPELLGWIDTVHQFEVLCSIGTFAFNHPAFVFPTINEQQRLAGLAVGHPMLSEHARVDNDVYMDDQQSIMIITGANMAGKSTFLRAVGVNVVLALAGAPVCAREFDCPWLEIRSGMRTADSLKENQSYFYAELDRLKSIMDELRAGSRLLILLDEILKGTNSTDKQAGSLALVNQLVHHKCLVIIATHDLSLGELEKAYPARILNYSFEANIENDQLSFDYKLKRGIAQKMNATFLMRKMGIIPPG